MEDPKSITEHSTPNWDRDVQMVEKTVSVEVELPLSVNDIFNWLTNCENFDSLRYLGNYALRCAEGLENPDEDDFRSRA